ncbi:MAG TPA: peptide ABC transporter substrate-binding protein [Candidatus Cybelea sp.]|nr:peptide ABC transporter substrate-binding protein [Candidatus Cybelea sp.]
MKEALRKLLLPAVAAAVLTAGAFTAQAETVLHRGNGAEPETLDPQKSTGVPEANIQYELFEGLTTYTPDGKIVPGMAEKWEVSDDGLTYTFHLRDSKWSNGDPVTAGDFVFAFRRLVDPATASDYAYIISDVVANASEISAGTEKDITKLGIQAVDDHTLKITLAHATPYFLGLLRHSSLLPVNENSVKAHPDDWTKPGNLVSNGAYQLTEWTPQASLTMVKNPNYYGADKVKIDKLVYYPTEDLGEEFKRFRAGELDVTYDTPSDQIKYVMANMKDQFQNSPYLGTYYYVINLTKEPLGKQPALREALALAVDRDKLVEKITQSGELPAYSWVCPGIHGWDQQFTDFKDMTQADREAKAKKLLADNGYGPNNPLSVEILYNTNENHKKIAVAIQSMWKAIGVQATITNQEWKVYLGSRHDKQFQVARAGWIGDYEDPTTFLTLFLSDAGPQNDAGYNNPDYDKLVKGSAMETDPDKRMKMLEQAEAIFLKDLPIIPIYHYTTKHMVSPKLVGWEPNVLDYHLARDLSFKD